MKKIKLFEYDIMLLFLMNGLNLGLIEENYITIIFSMLIGFIPLFIFIKTKNINKLDITSFGNIFGNIINIILVIIAFLISIIATSNLIDFISNEYLYNTPKSFISIFFAVPFIYILTKDIKVISRTLVIFFFIEIILFLLSIFGLFNQIKINELLVFNTDNIIPKSIKVISFIVLPIFFTSVFKKEEIQNNKQLKQHMITTYIIGSIIVFIIKIFNIGILGNDLLKLYKYPEHAVLKLANIGGIINNIGSILSIFWIINLFCFIVITLYYSKRSLIQITKFKNIHIIFSILIFLVIVMPVNTSLLCKIYIPLSLIFFVAIPLLAIIKDSK